MCYFCNLFGGAEAANFFVNIAANVDKVSLLEHEMGSKKHKKHKSERKERHESPNSLEKPGLKLILKVGSQGTPEHTNEWQYPGYNVDNSEMLRAHHKKSKKKKKKKDRNKDRERKHRHHHKEKKRRRDEESGVSFNLEEPIGEPEESMLVNDENSIGSPGN